MKPNGRELDLWAEVWALPQALMWERDHHEHAVALYVRGLTKLENPDAPATLLAQVRQFAESLGLTPPGMARNRWKIGRPALVAVPSTPAPTANPARARLQAVADETKRGEATAS